MATNPKRPRRARASQSKTAGDPRDRVIDALMTLLAGASFGSVALADIAKDAKVSLAELRGLYASKAAILAIFLAVSISRYSMAALPKATVLATGCSTS